MSEDESGKKRTKKHRKWVADCERRSDRRTAEFLARRFGDLQEELADLIPDLRSFEHYGEIEDLSWCLMLMQRLKRKYKGFPTTVSGPNELCDMTACGRGASAGTLSGDMMRSKSDRVALLLAVVAAGLIVSYVSPVGCQTTQPSNLPTTKMKVGDRIFTLEIASTHASRELGLMHRKSMPTDRGMIFVFQEEDELSFWMKNTRIPLDIIYVNSMSEVVSIKPMKPYDLSSVPSDKPAQYAIELNQGMAAKIGVKPGDKLNFPKEVTDAAKKPN